MKKKEFQNLPSTDTPINAENLNEMQDNIEESCVIVSPTQPTTNEKVWIQKGKNWWNIKKDTVGFINENGEIKNYWEWAYSPLMEVKPSSDFTISCKKDNTTEVLQMSVLEYDENKNFIQITAANSETPEKTEFSQNITLTSSTHYIRLQHRTNTGQYDFQFEPGLTATDYEEYIPKKIEAKNDNGVFENIYDEEAMLANEYKEANLNGSLFFYKLGKMVFVNGIYPINAANASIIFPYKPVDMVRFPVTSLSNTNEVKNIVGIGIAGEDGVCGINMTEAVTYAIMSFCYTTND